jgi:short subunit dehydrogenase-like uncharacterized protein
MAPQHMLYGATGCSFSLAAREAERVGLEFVIGGRNKSKVEALAVLFDILYCVSPPSDVTKL